MAGGVDVFAKQNLATSYVSYDSKTVGANLRLGFALTEELSLQPHYSIYRQEISLADRYNCCPCVTRRRGDTARRPRCRYARNWRPDQ